LTQLHPNSHFVGNTLSIASDASTPSHRRFMIALYSPDLLGKNRTGFLLSREKRSKLALHRLEGRFL
jgi:hypothetical protein